ncbi:MAG: NADH-quinone oxidoreductase subunit M [Candidatus Eremiobacteraeota bacterium]|nr:NADH-quinone oxidoreductase subunit M [Candidatus Eremiobacteraeota bacterium]MBC5827647.1 NADH-quinone oxidoreductase subunit M [Candidatus Eremiobacteraeota bacterium]
MLLNTVIFLPLAAAVILLLVPKGDARPAKAIALAGAVATFALSLAFLGAGPNASAQFSIPWITGALPASYHLRVDGISLFFVLLTTLVSVPAIWAAFSYADQRRLRGYLFLLLAFETTLLGVFTAGDLLLFYVYWDLMLIPVFLLLAGYTDSAAARRAAWGYLIYNGAGGLVLLLGIVGMVAVTRTFEVLGHSFAFSAAAEPWLFAAFALAFLIKTPVFPFHGWMPATYTQAPSPVVAMVAGVQSKAGLYGFLVFALPLFPNAAHRFAGPLVALGVISVLYGAFTALGQRDMKTLVAFSSLSHLGLVILALFAFDITSVPASILMVVSHGLIAAALFLLLGFIEERTRTRDLSAFGGLGARAPRLQVLMLIAAMAALGLPGLSGFAGEFLIFIGSWQTQPVATAISLLSVILATVYVLRVFQGAMNGPLSAPADARITELRPREGWLVAPLLAAMFWLGVWPAWLNDRTPTTVGSHEAQTAVPHKAQAIAESKVLSGLLGASETAR